MELVAERHEIAARYKEWEITGAPGKTTYLPTYLRMCVRNFILTTKQGPNDKPVQGGTMQKAIGYIRVSTQGQADEGVSLDAQRAKIAAWCSLNDAELVAVFEDAGISGASMNGREGLHAALKATCKGMALVSYSISRLARSTRDMLEIAERLDAKGADLVSLTEKIDTTTAAGRMVFKMLAVLADFERDQIGERTKMALAHKKAKGEVYAATPFGFDAIEGRLVEVKHEAKIVGDILRMREAGQSLADIAGALNTQGIEGKRGGRWYASTVRYLIQRQAA